MTMKDTYIRTRDLGIIGIVGSLLFASVIYVATSEQEYTPTDVKTHEQSTDESERV